MSSLFHCLSDLCDWLLQVDEALAVLREMVARGCERNTVTYAALIAACERAGRPGAARELFTEMQQEGVKPNVSIYNAVIGACSQSELPICWLNLPTAEFT